MTYRKAGETVSCSGGRAPTGVVIAPVSKRLPKPARNGAFHWSGAGGSKGQRLQQRLE